MDGTVCPALLRDPWWATTSRATKERELFGDDGARWVEEIGKVPEMWVISAGAGAGAGAGRDGNPGVGEESVGWIAWLELGILSMFCYLGKASW